MSNGGFMSYRLACELSDRIAAIAPVAGDMNVPACNTGREVPVIHFHSVADSAVPYWGGIGNGPSNHYNPPLDSVMNVWVNFNSCNTPGDTIQNDTSYMLVKWSDCDCGVEVHYYLTQDGGHSWPGGTKPLPSSDDCSQVINANDLIWDFFQQHTLDCATSKVHNSKLEPDNNLNVYPNPTGSMIRVNNSSVELREYRIYDSEGKLVLSGMLNDETDLDVSGLKSGLYLIKIEDGYKLVTRKLIIQN